MGRLKRQCLQRVLKNQVMELKEFILSSSIMKALASILDRCLHLLIEFLITSDSNPRCNTTQCMLHIRDWMIVSKIIGALDLVALSTYQKPEIGRSSSQAMTVQNFGLMG